MKEVRYLIFDPVTLNSEGQLDLETWYRTWDDFEAKAKDLVQNGFEPVGAKMIPTRWLHNFKFVKATGFAGVVARVREALQLLGR